MSQDSSSAQGVAWNLTHLYDSPEDPRIEQTLADSHALADQFADDYRGRIISGEMSGKELLEAIQKLEGLVNELSKPMSLASLMFSADTSDPAHGAFYQAMQEASSAVRVKLMFFSIELQKAPQDWIDHCLADPALVDYQHYISVERIYAPFTLSEEKEVLLEETSNVGSRAWVRLHEEVLSSQRFSYADPKTGDVTELTQQGVLSKLYSSDRAERQAAADCFSAGLLTVEKTIAFIYNTLLADKALEDRLRGQDEPENSRHLANELTSEIVDLVMQICRERSDVVARYYRVKKEILGLDELTHVDRYAPLFEAKQTVDWAEAKEIVLKSFGAFSQEMADRAEEFFDQDWIDAEPRDGKRGGAFCSYCTPDTHPVILQTYQDKLSDVMTLAHELGHGVHASVSRDQSYFNFHGTLPLAELASIFGEMLVFEEITKSASAKDKTALYGEKLEGIFASVHRQAAMFRFEQQCHRLRREQGELSPEQFRELWQQEMQSMFEDSVSLKDQHAHWWLYVGHFFFAPFYVYAYSFGELLTLALYQKAKSEGPGFADKYLEVLKLGGKEEPVKLMQRLDVDLADRRFWEGGFEVIESLTTDFEKYWAECKGQ